MTKISLNWNNVHSFGRVQYERPYRLQRTIRLERTGRYGRWIRGCITKRFTVSHINGGRIPQLERGRFRMGKNIPQSWLLQLPHLVVSAESFTLVDFHLSICLPPMFLFFFSCFLWSFTILSFTTLNPTCKSLFAIGITIPEECRLCPSLIEMPWNCLVCDSIADSL